MALLCTEPVCFSTEKYGCSTDGLVCCLNAWQLRQFTSWWCPIQSASRLNTMGTSQIIKLLDTKKGLFKNENKRKKTWISSIIFPCWVSTKRILTHLESDTLPTSSSLFNGFSLESGNQQDLSRSFFLNHIR